MFSQLGPLFKTTLRQAEKADTRLEIRREEKEHQGKKQDFEEEGADTSALWEDSTAVSVEALRTFLIEFLRGRGEDAGPAGVTAQATHYVPAAPSAVSPTAARAAQAYASTASHAAPPPPPEPAEEESGDLADLLKADELRTIHVLIHELDVLSRRGIQTLVIEKADTFLEALVQAVRLQKASL